MTNNFRRCTTVGWKKQEHILAIGGMRDGLNNL